MSAGQRIALAVAALAALVFVAPGAFGLAPDLGPPAAIVALTLGLWATGALPPHIASLIMFAAVTVLGIAPPSVIFAGFAATALWLVFGGLVIGAATGTTGLGRRFAEATAARLQGDYRRIVYGTVALAVALAFLIPSTLGRLVILMPLMHALCDAYGLEEGGRGRIGVMLAAGIGTNAPAFAILPANLPTVVAMGAAETVQGLTVTYGAFLLLHFPVYGLLKALLIAEVLTRVYRASPQANNQHFAPRPWSAAERRLLAVMLLALAAWATDFWHGIAPGWVALTAGLVLLLPRVGVLPADAFNEVKFDSLFYIAGVLGVAALIDHSGLSDAIGGALLALEPFAADAPVRNFLTLAVITTITALFTTAAGLAAVVTPIADEVAAAAGLPLVTVIMVQIVAFASVLLPYEVAPLMVALQLGRVPLRDGTLTVFAFGLTNLALLTPLNALWWRYLGYL